jgi:6-phosphogluconolactonase
MNPILAALGVGALIGLAATARAASPSCWVYFGTSSSDDNRGIYRAKLDQDAGSLSPAVRVADKANSQFLAFSPDKKHLYSLAAHANGGEHPHEAIETYEVDAATGDLNHIAERVVNGSEGCHISVDPTGRFVLTANYGEQYVEVFPVAKDFTVGERSCIVHHSGSGPDKTRQEKAHPHSINVDPSGRFAIVCDLGQDKVFIYKLDASNGTLSPNEPAFVSTEPGAGPRHFTFHPDGKHAFLINEMGWTITAFDWNGDKGTLTPLTTVPILSKSYSGPLNTSAEVVVAKSGNFVYGSNRGDNSLVVHTFDPETGKMEFVQRITEGIDTPRNYAIDPSGKWLVCANLKANTATLYGVDPQTGRLTLTGTIKVPEALCVRFVQAAGS